jgi:cytochrome c oxidase subunit 4
MSTETVESAHRAGHEPAAPHDATHDHPSERKYIQIALILGVLTALEIVTFYIEEDLGSLLVPILLVMMVIKFFMVAAWFMHLRFDSRLFSRLFLSGLLLAVGVYIAALATFEFFS